MSARGGGATRVSARPRSRPSARRPAAPPPRPPSSAGGRRRSAAVVAALLLVAAAVWGVVAARRPDRVRLPERVDLAADALAGVTVVIDPGHGGDDPGAVHDGVGEATLTYRAASELAAVVRAAGGRPVWTVRSVALLAHLREDGREPALVAPDDASPPTGPRRLLQSGADRPEDLYARASVGADAWRRHGPSVVFVSLHFDARSDPSLRGGGVYVDTRQGPRPRCAAALGRALRAQGLGGMLHVRRLGVLAPAVNPVPQRVLLELATLTNGTDRRAATDARWRWRVVRLVAATLADCSRAA